MEQLYLKILIGILTLITAILGYNKFSKNKVNKVDQKNIKIKGKNNTIVGGDLKKDD